MIGRLEQADAVLDQWLAGHPTWNGFLFAVIGVLIVPFAKLIAALWRRLTYIPTLLDLLFEAAGEIHVVISHMPYANFQRLGSKRTIALPENAPLLPSGVALGLQRLTSYVHRRWGDRKTLRLHFDDEQWPIAESDFIALGGPYVNEVVGHIVEAVKVPGFSIEDVPFGAVGSGIFEPVAHDESDVFEAQREAGSKEPNARLACDYGFMLHVDNPWNADRKAFVVFGLWPHGVLAAVDCLLAPRRAGSLARHFHRVIANRRNVVGILRVTIAGFLDGHGDLVKVRVLD